MLTLQQLEAIETCNNAIRYLIRDNQMASSGGRITVIEAMQILQAGRNRAAVLQREQFEAYVDRFQNAQPCWEGGR